MIALLKLPLLKILIPLLGVFWVLAVVAVYLWSKDQLRVRVRSTRSASRPPGYAVDIVLGRRYLDLTLWALTIGFVPTYTTLSYARSHAALTSIFLAGAGALITALALLRGRGCMRSIRRLRVDREGKLLVGRLLDVMLSSEFHVFHDISLEGQVIDHVAVGPTGAYAVTTRTREPDDESTADAEGTVIVDGGRLRFPGNGQNDDVLGIAQARGKARWLEEWMAATTREHYPVHPVLVLPGWQLDVKRDPGIRVLNERTVETLNDGRRILQPTEIYEIARHVERCCRMERDRHAEAGCLPAGYSTDEPQ